MVSRTKLRQVGDFGRLQHTFFFPSESVVHEKKDFTHQGRGGQKEKDDSPKYNKRSIAHSIETKTHGDLLHRGHVRPSPGGSALLERGSLPLERGLERRLLEWRLLALQ